MTSGFHLVSLRLAGTDRPDSLLTFEPGLNVVSGPSDTGKSYIIQCINFMLGGSDTPKKVREAEGYERAHLTVRDLATKREYTLARSLKGGNFELVSPDIDMAILKPKHDGQADDNVSAFLLSLCGLENRSVVTNQRGKTRAISFRDVVRLVLIDEKQIITEGSPVLSGQHISKTSELSLFSVFLTGTDYSSVVEQPEPKVQKARLEAQIALLDELTEDAKSKLENLEFGNRDPDVEVARIRAQLDDAMKDVAAARDDLTSLETSRREAWASRKRAESRLLVISELQERFELLDDHYASDTARLGTILEVDALFERLPEERCPLCGSLFADHKDEHQEAISLQHLRVAATEENVKVARLREDLRKAQEEQAREKQQLEDAIGKSGAEHDELQRQILGLLRPREREAIATMRSLMTERRRFEYAKQLQEELKSHAARRQLCELQLKTKPVRHAFSFASTAEAAGFSSTVHGLLKAWRYPELENVAFSVDSNDIVIGSRVRGSQGKGYRAITYAAFVIGLMRYSIKHGRGHPQFVVLDSPLVTLRSPDANPGDEISEDVKVAFYESLAKPGTQEQVLVLENDDPPKSIENAINYVHFTKSRGFGRYGFFPPKHDES